jgi:hypothetical protein
MDISESEMRVSASPAIDKIFRQGAGKTCHEEAAIVLENQSFVAS